MKKFLLLLTLAFAAFTGLSTSRAADAPKKPEPTLEQRVAGLEAYIANTDPTIPLKVKTKDKDGKEVETVPEGLTTVAASNPGPGHNGFQMVCAALVLFMTLPGLFLFYGGLVRKKPQLEWQGGRVGLHEPPGKKRPGARRHHQAPLSRRMVAQRLNVST